MGRWFLAHPVLVVERVGTGQGFVWLIPSVCLVASLADACAILRHLVAVLDGELLAARCLAAHVGFGLHKA